MAKEPSPAFQFYPKDYLSDVKTRAMTFEQRGMYWDLCSYCWLEGGLPSDPIQIARILGTPEEPFVRDHWPALSMCFRPLTETTIEQPRLGIERRKQQKRREKMAEGGRRSADRRKVEPSTLQGASKVAATTLQGGTNSSSSTPVVPPLPPTGGNHVEAIERSGILAEAEASERAGAFFDRWRAIYQTYANGATYPLVASPKDYRDLLTLVTQYPDDGYLDDIAKTFIKAKMRTWGEDRKSLGWLVRVASDVDRELRAVGARPKVVA